MRRQNLWAVTVGAGRCPECGEEPNAEHRPGPWEKFRYWLVNGGRAPTTLHCRNNHQWSRSSRMVALSGPGSGRRWTHLPAQLLRTLLAERRMHPVPLTYVMASGVGLMLGLLLDLVLGWPWWVVAAGFVFLTWLFFLSSAFRGRRGDIGYQLLRVIDPQRAETRQVQRLEDALASGSLAGYEVCGWNGEKAIAGWGGRPVPHTLKIRHGLIDDDAGWVEVTTHTEDDSESNRVRVRLEERLLRSQFPDPGDTRPEDLHRWRQERQRAIDNAERPAWRTRPFRLEGELIPGQIAQAGSHWVAYLKVGEITVELMGNRVDPESIRLTPIATLDSYTNRA